MKKTSELHNSEILKKKRKQKTWVKLLGKYLLSKISELRNLFLFFYFHFFILKDLVTKISYDVAIWLYSVLWRHNP